ncbi:hypothetical protein Scep_024175 [Stephania cephalantha]|uniref:Uncharacterized protein n=1 Tax=Stephania cephalantha TaxID=152367 RepID=A0AAP0EYT9_9MAGN
MGRQMQFLSQQMIGSKDGIVLENVDDTSSSSLYRVPLSPIDDSHTTKVNPTNDVECSFGKVNIVTSGLGAINAFLSKDKTMIEDDQCANGQEKYSAVIRHNNSQHMKNVAVKEFESEVKKEREIEVEPALNEEPIDIGGKDNNEAEKVTTTMESL